MPNILFLLFEILSIATFVFILARELFKKRGYVYMLLAGAVSGTILELIAIHSSHTYSYESFLFTIKGFPLFIGMNWALVFYVAMSFSDQFEIPWSIKPCLDALIALNLDLAIDAIAIRLGFWHWVIPLDQEWYGVPFENLVGWILVPLVFSFLIRFIWRFNPKRLLVKISKLLLPLLTTLIVVVLSVLYMALALIPFHISRVFKWSELWVLYRKFTFPSISFQPEVQLWKLIILVFIVSQLISISFYYLIKHGKVKRFDMVSFSLLTFVHLIFLIMYFATGMFVKEPFLLFVALLMLGLHLTIHIFLPFGLVQLNWLRKLKTLASK